MSNAPGLLNELRISDAVTFLAVHRYGSISSAARELRVTPSQVSKSIARLEAILGSTLLSRTPSGVSLVDAGLRVLPHFEQLLETTRKLSPEATGEGRVLTVAAPSWMAISLLPAVVTRELGFRMRVLELVPAQVRAHLSTGYFDVALTLGPLALQPSWETQRVGQITKAVFVRPDVAATLGEPPIPAERLAGLEFVSPIYLTEAGYLPVDDDCPIARRDRLIGHETTTLAVALALVSQTRQAVFGPVLGAVDYLRAGTLVKLDVEGWQLRDDIYVAYNIDRITVVEQRALVASLEQALADLAPITS